MNAPPVGTIAGFAKAFAQTGKGNGLTKEELLTFFRTYSANIPDPEFYGQTLTKQKLFHYCLERLHIEDQYRALIDLCCVPPETKNPLPSLGGGGEVTRCTPPGRCRQRCESPSGHSFVLVPSARLA